VNKDSINDRAKWVSRNGQRKLLRRSAVGKTSGERRRMRNERSVAVAEDFVEDVEEDVGVMLLEDEGWSHTNWTLTTAADDNTFTRSTHTHTPSQRPFHFPGKPEIFSKILRIVILFGWLGGVTVRASDLRSSDRGFDSRSCHYQSTWVNSAFHPSEVGKSSTAGLAGVMAGRAHLCRVAGNTVWSHMASDAP